MTTMMERFAGAPTAEKTLALVTDMARRPLKFFIHSGDIGDLIYGLATVKAMGGGVIMVRQSPVTRRLMTPDTFPLFVPLLMRQPYVHGVIPCVDDQPMPKSVVMLDHFRKQLELAAVAPDRGRGLNIAEAHRSCFPSLPPLDAERAWLEVDRPETVAGRGVVFSRTPRYRNGWFPWRRVYEAYGHRAVFIGLEDEHRAFEVEVGPGVPHLRTANLLEAARIIAGARLFVGNQSALYAIAEGLKVTTIQETCPDQPNCIFPRWNATHVSGDGADLDLPTGAEARQAQVRLAVFVPTLTRADLLERNYAAMPRQLAGLSGSDCIPRDRLLILDNGDQRIGLPSREVIVRRPPGHKNLGVGASWNYGVEWARAGYEGSQFDAIAILQDDVAWDLPQILAAKRLILECPDVDLFLSYHQYSVQVFRLNPPAGRRLPPYDERFSGWCGDDDYGLELTRRGLVYRRFHELDPVPGKSGTCGTHKPQTRSDAQKLLIEKWGTNKFEVNNSAAPWYVTNEFFTARLNRQP